MNNSTILPVQFSGKSDVGKEREKNEDSFIALHIEPKDENPLGIRAVMVVADGMGGHVGGEKASSAAVRLVEEVFHTEKKKSLGKYDGDVDKAVRAIVKTADNRVRDIGKGMEKPPGTTFTGVFVVDNRAYVGHMGDSRAYHIRNDEMVRITEDHSFVGKMIREGKLTPEEAEDFPQKNILLKSLGAGEPQEIEEPYRVSLMDGDVILLCSDGLWDLVSDKEILGLIHGEKNLDNACNSMIKLANQRGGHDNITVLTAEFGKFNRNPVVARTLKDIVKQTPTTTKKTKGNINKRNLLKAAVLLLSGIFIFLIGWIVKDFIKPAPGGGGSGTPGESPSGLTGDWKTPPGFTSNWQNRGEIELHIGKPPGTGTVTPPAKGPDEKGSTAGGNIVTPGTKGSGETGIEVKPGKKGKSGTRRPPKGGGAPKTGGGVTGGGKGDGSGDSSIIDKDSDKKAKKKKRFNFKLWQDKRTDNKGKTKPTKPKTKKPEPTEPGLTEPETTEPAPTEPAPNNQAPNNPPPNNQAPNNQAPTMI